VHFKDEDWPVYRSHCYFELKFQIKECTLYVCKYGHTKIHSRKTGYARCELVIWAQD